jgi:putative ABC transport system substrate-binding protein
MAKSQRKENPMKHLKKLVALALTVALLLPALFAFAQNDLPIIGIVQIVEHPSLDASRQGFLDELAVLGYKDGENHHQWNTTTPRAARTRWPPSQTTLVSPRTPTWYWPLHNRLRADDGQQNRNHPDPGHCHHRLCRCPPGGIKRKAGHNVSGTSDMSSISDQIALLLRMVPDTKTVGLLYTASEDNSVLQARIAKEIIESQGLAYTEVTVQNSNDVQQATLSIVDKCDAIYIPTDNVFASAMPVVYEVAVQAKKPVVCGDTSMVKLGGIGTIAISYYNLG